MLIDMMRNGSNSVFGKIVFSVIMLAAVVGLGLGFNTTFRSGGDDVATVAGEGIPVQTFDHTVRNILTSNHIDMKAAIAAGGIDKILQGEIRDRLVGRAAYDLGLRPDDAGVRAELKRELAPLVTPDRSAADILKEQLALKGETEAQLSEELKSQISGQILQGAIQSGATTVPPDEIGDLARFAEEQRTVRYVFLPDSAVTDYKAPTDAVLTPFYDLGKGRYVVPEMRRFSLLVLRPDAGAVTVSDADLQKSYQEDIAKYQEPERRRMTQAVLKNQAEAQAVADKIRGGMGVEAAVQAVTHKTAAYVGTQDFTKDGLAPEIAGPAFAAAKGAIIGPLQTALGWHVLKLEDILPPVTRPFDSVKDDLRAEVAKGMASDALYARATKIDDSLSGGSSLEDVAKDNGLTVQKIGAVDAFGHGDGMAQLTAFDADTPGLIKAAFQTEEGEAAPSIELKSGGYAIVRVDAITARSYKPFAAVRNDLAKVWIGDQQNVINGEKAHSAVSTLDAQTTTMDQLAAANHASVQTATLTRDGMPPAPFTMTALQKFMDLSKGQHAGATAKGGYIVGEVETADLPAKPSPDDVAKVIEKEKQAAGERYTTEYLAYLRTRYGVKTNDALIAKMYGDAGPAQTSAP